MNADEFICFIDKQRGTQAWCNDALLLAQALDMYAKLRGGAVNHVGPEKQYSTKELISCLSNAFENGYELLGETDIGDLLIECEKENEMARLTTDPKDPGLGHGADKSPVPQQEVYLVLSGAERKKGFIRPFRDSYRHVGTKPQYPLRDLTDEEKERYKDQNYVKFEIYPESMSPKTGKFWTQESLGKTGCGTVTIMGQVLSETYARDPNFYGSTYCVGCKMHRPVAEFVWVADGETVGS